MLKNFYRFCLGFFIFFTLFAPVNAQEQDVLVPDPNAETSQDSYYKAKVLEIKDSGVLEIGEGIENHYQDLLIEILDGPDKGLKIDFTHGREFSINENQLLREGEVFIVMKVNRVDGSSIWVYIDKYRVNSYLTIAGMFLLAILIFARFRGLMSVFGLVISIGIIVFYLVPRIAQGENPVFVSLVASLLITFFSIFPSHGLSRHSVLSVVAILITLAMAASLSSLFVSMASLSGLGSEEAYYLQLGGENHLDLKGLLLAGILLGALGVLDDVATTQVAAAEEISRANKRLKFKELYRRSLSVGRAHIVSLVNTLVLAYVGTSLPLMIVFSSTATPLWVLLNGEIIGTEIIRTLVGSSALVLAIPISTLIAALSYSKNPAKGAIGHEDFHPHH